MRCADDNPGCGEPKPGLGREAHNYYFEDAAGHTPGSIADGFDTTKYPDLSHASEFGWVGMAGYENFAR